MEKEFYEQKKKRLLEIGESFSSHFEERIRRIESKKINKYPPGELALYLIREKGCSVSDEEIESIAQRCGYRSRTIKEKYKNWIEIYTEEIGSNDYRGSRWENCWWHRLKELEDVIGGQNQNLVAKENDTIDWEQRRWDLAVQIFMDAPYTPIEQTAMEAVNKADAFIKQYKWILSQEK